MFYSLLVTNADVPEFQYYLEDFDMCFTFEKKITRMNKML